MTGSWRDGSVRWRLGRLAFGFTWNLGALPRPRLYRYRDQPECFGLHLLDCSQMDSVLSIDFEWTWK